MKRKFLAAKVNINGNIFNQNVQELIELIPEAIKSKKILKTKKSVWEWQFTEIEEIPYKDGYILCGKFNKSRKEFKTVIENGETKILIPLEMEKYINFFKIFIGK